MKLLVDEDSQAYRLLEVLRQAGHDVMSVAELGRNGASDDQVFALAQSQQRVVLTQNVDDFLALADDAGEHAGLLVIFCDNDSRKSMGFDDIVCAIAALEASGLPLRGQSHTLNYWY